jgi:hypothetical protein
MDNLLPVLAAVEAIINQLKNVNFVQLEADGVLLQADAQKIVADATQAGNDFAKLLNDLKAALAKPGA